MTGPFPNVKTSIAGDAGAIEIAAHVPTDDTGSAAPRAVAVVAHPHPLYGGTMDNKVVTTIARAFYDANAAVLNVFGNNFIDIVGIDIGVPNIVRVDHHHRAFIAAIQAARRIHAHLARPVQLQRFDPIFRVAAHALGIVLIAKRAAIVALVAAEKNMVLKKIGRASCRERV